MSDTGESLWETTAVQNLIRYKPSGAYFARFRAGGRLIRQSLNTAVFSVAKQRLPDKMHDYRSRHESRQSFAHGKMTVADATEVYLRKVLASVSLKPRSKDYREMMVAFIRRSWPTLMEADVRKISNRDCEASLIGYQQHYAPTVVNNSIGTCARFSMKPSALARVSIIRLRASRESRPLSCLQRRANRRG